MSDEPAAESERPTDCEPSREPIPLSPAYCLDSATESESATEPAAPLDGGAPSPEGEEQALRVARLRAQVAAGAYRPTAEDIARAMVERATS